MNLPIGRKALPRYETRLDKKASAQRLTTHDRKADEGRGNGGGDSDGGNGIGLLAGLAIAGAATAALYPMVKKALDSQSDDSPLESVAASVTIDVPASEIYAFWRRFEQFDRFMPQVVSIEKEDERLSEWTVKGPGGKEFSFSSEITEDVPNERIAWAACHTAAKHEGMVTFRETPRGTVVRLAMRFHPVGGTLTMAVARLIGKSTGTDPKQQARQALKQLKQMFETGEMATASPDKAAPAIDALVAGGGMAGALS